MPTLDQLQGGQVVPVPEVKISPAVTQVNAINNQMRSSILEQCKRYGIPILCDDIPDLCNAGSAVLTVILPAISSQIKDYLPNEQLNSHYMNYADAFGGQILRGCTQLFLEEKNRRTRVQGITNIVSGTTLALVTTVGETLDPETDSAITSTALATAMGITFLMACEMIRYAASKPADTDEARQQRKTEIASAIGEAFYTGSLFFGTVMLCFPSEESQMAAVILLGAFSSIYFGKEIKKIGQCVSTLFNCNKNNNSNDVQVADPGQTPYIPLVEPKVSVGP